MANYRFYLERGNVRSREISFDLPDASAIDPVAKQVARRFAASEIGSGHLRLAQDIAVLDEADAVVARYSLGDFLTVDSQAEGDRAA